MKNNEIRKALIVVDMQNDFVTGALGSAEAVRIVPAVAKKVREAKENGYAVVFTADTHHDDYLDTEEGKNLPVPHTKEGTEGWKIIPDLSGYVGGEYRGTLSPGLAYLVRKPTFGSVALGEALKEYAPDIIELTGVCTGICVISNTLIAKAFCPNAHIIVHKECCACLTAETHQTALKAMKLCQVEIV